VKDFCKHLSINLTKLLMTAYLRRSGHGILSFIYLFKHTLRVAIETSCFLLKNPPLKYALVGDKIIVAHIASNFRKKYAIHFL